ncbi:O-antigen ligase family protein [Rhizobium sp. SIMBA_035]
MHFQIMGLLTLVLGAAALYMPPVWSFLLIFVSTVFGSAAAFNLSGLGGASVLVPNLFLVFFFIRVLMSCGEGRILAAFAPSRIGFYLLALTVFGLVTAVFFPRLFQGMAETMIVERQVGARSFIALQPLRFSSNNITQSVYAVGGLLCFACTFAWFRREGIATSLVTALIVTTVVDLSFAVADIITYYSHTEWLMSFVHTANYALLTASEKGGLKRISGTFPEASAFADYTLVLFAAVSSLWLDGVRKKITGILSLALLTSLLLSTSATALVGVAAIMPFLLIRAIRGRHALAITLGAAALPLLAVIVVVALPDLATGLHDFLDEMVLSKADSQSGRERFMWNSVAYESFVNTYGFGAGLGSARASSFVLVLLSNLGVAGTAIFVIFSLAVVLAHLPQHDAERPEDIAAVRAAKLGFFAVLVTATISGTVYDLGLTFYILAGSVAALTLPRALNRPAQTAPAFRFRSSQDAAQAHS